MNQEDFSQLQSFLGPAQKVLILTGDNPSLDSLGASLALYLGLSRIGKTVAIACPKSPTVGLSNLVGIDRVQNDLGGQNLIVSFPYTEGAIEKVSYNIEGDRFNLTIQPKQGAQPLLPQAVKFSQGGASYDVIFIIGARDLHELGSLYEKEKDLYEKIPLVVINNKSEAKNFGRVNFIDSYASSLSEIAGTVLTKSGVDFDPDIAHNLLTGIDFATRNFSLPTTSADAFEIAANCLKSGARRNTSRPVSEEKPYVRPRSVGFQHPQPRVKTDVSEEEEAPPDWLAPKIFKGSDLP